MSLPDLKIYKIRTLQDFKLVPRERLAACLAELPAFLDYDTQRRTELYGQGITVVESGFDWCDDGDVGTVTGETLEIV